MPGVTKNQGAVPISSASNRGGGPVDVPMLAQGAAPTPENRLSFEKVAAEKFGDVELYRLTNQGSRDCLWDWDVSSNTLYLSPRHKELLGY
jgi:hypothetical protein